MKTAFLVIFFVCFGITTEVFFTAIYDFIAQWPDGDVKLKGYTYVWMAPIYALIPILMPKGYQLMAKWPLILRSVVYMIGIFVIEFIAGWLLDVMIGVCPWDYTGSTMFPATDNPYIRLEFAPAWMVFGILIEKFLLYMQRQLR